MAMKPENLPALVRRAEIERDLRGVSDLDTGIKDTLTEILETVSDPPPMENSIKDFPFIDRESSIPRPKKPG